MKRCDMPKCFGDAEKWGISIYITNERNYKDESYEMMAVELCKKHYDAAVGGILKGLAEKTPGIMVREKNK